MPRKPLALSLLLVAALMSVAACSGGKDAGPTGASNSSSKSTSGTPSSGKLVRVKDKGGVKNVYAKTASGSKVSLYAASPGHAVMSQLYDKTTKRWSAPTTIFKDDTRFCHSIKLKATGDILAATVVCSISSQDKSGTQSSYVLASTDGKTWKRMDLTGGSGNPSISPGGKYVSWTATTSFLLWNPEWDSFTTVKYTQSTAEPTVGVTQNNGMLVMVKATPQPKKACIVSFQSASAKAPTPKPGNSTLPLQAHPKCVITSAKMQGAELIANFNQTDTTKVNGSKQDEDDHVRLRIRQAGKRKVDREDLMPG